MCCRIGCEPIKLTATGCGVRIFKDMGLKSITAKVRRALFFLFKDSHILNSTYITIAEFFIIRPHGPNCWNGDGAFRLRVRLQITKKRMCQD